MEYDDVPDRDVISPEGGNHDHELWLPDGEGVHVSLRQVSKVTDGGETAAAQHSLQGGDHRGAGQLRGEASISNINPPPPDMLGQTLL